MQSIDVIKNINKNKNDISNINYELSKTENTKYTTANGIKEFSCKDGYVDNVVIEGETLVNIGTPSNFRTTTSVTTYYIWDLQNMDMTLNKTITAFNFSDKTIRIDVRDGNSASSSFVRAESVSSGSSKVISLGATEFIQNYNGALTSGWSEELKDTLKCSCIILEGDHTNKPISYFEGLKSIGQGDKIEVLTRNEGYNIYNGLSEDGDINSSNGADEVNTSRKRTCYIEIFGKKLYLSQSIARLVFYDSNKSFISCLTNISECDIPVNARLVRFSTITSNIDVKNVVVGYSSNVNSKFYKQDKKQILTTLRSLPNGVKDTIEKRGNKYYKIKRCGEVILNGNEDWIKGAVSSTTISYILNTSYGFKINGVCMSDKFIYEPNWNNGIEGVRLDQVGKLTIEINTTKLTTGLEATGFKTWLSSNPVTVVYELATPIIEELPNFNPQTFSDKTTLLLNSGAVQAEASFEVTNSLGSELEVLKNKVSDLDDYVVDEEVYYPALLNGWITHSADYTPCFVKNGNIVTFNLRIKGGTWSSGTILLYVPEQFRIKYGYASVFPAIDLANDKSYNAIMYKEGFLKLFSVDSEPTGGLAIGGSYYVG